MSLQENGPLPIELQERVLEKLGFSQAPPADLGGLEQIYAAWCFKVPFDNVRKLIDLAKDEPGPLPGSTACDFFENGWLKHGAGGTCWAGNGALHALLESLGFSASRGVATMLVAPDLPPNHGTVVVHLNEEDYIVDASIMHLAPIPLKDTIDGGSTTNARPFISALSRRNEKWHINWRPLHRPDGIECRIEYTPASHDEYLDRYERTRQWSPFNYELTARLMQSDRAIGIALNAWVELHCDGEHTRNEILSQQERIRFLVDGLGYSEEIALQIPRDRPTPPPPWSHAASAMKSET